MQGSKFASSCDNILTADMPSQLRVSNLNFGTLTAQKMELSVKDFFSKYEPRRFKTSLCKQM